MRRAARRRACKRPAPTPPVDGAAAQLSVTEIETWLRDPYAIYAKHVLKLRPLDALDEPIGPLERGTALHKALELFIARYPGALPDDARAQLIAIADAGVRRSWHSQGRAGGVAAALRRRGAWFVDFERERARRHRRARIWK